MFANLLSFCLVSHLSINPFTQVTITNKPEVADDWSDPMLIYCAQRSSRAVLPESGSHKMMCASFRYNNLTRGKTSSGASLGHFFIIHLQELA